MKTNSLGRLPGLSNEPATLAMGFSCWCFGVGKKWGKVHRLPQKLEEEKDGSDSTPFQERYG